MTLIINNKEVKQVLTMEDTMAALEQSYLQLAAQEAVCRPCGARQSAGRPVPHGGGQGLRARQANRPRA